MSIYPKSEAMVTVFALTEEEKNKIKSGLVTAFEENIETNQDRALRALELAKFTEERSWEIKKNLWQLFDLESELKNEVQEDLKNLETAYADGAEDPVILAEAISCKAVDAGIFADRFVKVKRGETVVEPVLPIKEAIGNELGEGEIIIK